MLLALGAILTTYGKCTARDLPASDSETQRHLAVASERLASLTVTMSPEAIAEALATLAPLMKREQQGLLAQIVLFYPTATPLQRQGLMIVRDKVINLPGPSEVQALAPFVESDDEKLRGIALSILESSARKCSSLEPNLEPALLYMSGPGRNQPHDNLIRFVFKLDPCRALWGMERIVNNGGNTELVLKSRRIDDALWLDRESVTFPSKVTLEEFHKALPAAEQALFDLAGNETWWVRLCAAEVARKHPRLRTEKIMERLRGDKHPAILHVLEEIRAVGD
ncbi:MAG: hypothetical protein AB7O68_17015 [Pirellulales bacterium]